MKRSISREERQHNQSMCQRDDNRSMYQGDDNWSIITAQHENLRSTCLPRMSEDQRSAITKEESIDSILKDIELMIQSIQSKNLDIENFVQKISDLHEKVQEAWQNEPASMEEKGTYKEKLGLAKEISKELIIESKKLIDLDPDLLIGVKKFISITVKSKIEKVKDLISSNEPVSSMFRRLSQNETQDHTSLYDLCNSYKMTGLQESQITLPKNFIEDLINLVEQKPKIGSRQIKNKAKLKEVLQKDISNITTEKITGNTEAIEAQWVKVMAQKIITEKFEDAENKEHMLTEINKLAENPAERVKILKEELEIKDKIEEITNEAKDALEYHKQQQTAPKKSGLQSKLTPDLNFEEKTKDRLERYKEAIPERYQDRFHFIEYYIHEILEDYILRVISWQDSNKLSPDSKLVKQHILIASLDDITSIVRGFRMKDIGEQGGHENYKKSLDGKIKGYEKIHKYFGSIVLGSGSGENAILEERPINHDDYTYDFEGKKKFVQWQYRNLNRPLMANSEGSNDRKVYSQDLKKKINEIQNNKIIEIWQNSLDNFDGIDKNEIIEYIKSQYDTLLELCKDTAKDCEDRKKAYDDRKKPRSGKK